MFLKEKIGNWTWRIGLLIFLALFLQSCGIPRGDKTLKEKNVAVRDAGVASNKATFALG